MRLAADANVTEADDSTRQLDRLRWRIVLTERIAQPLVHVIHGLSELVVSCALRQVTLPDEPGSHLVEELWRQFVGSDEPFKHGQQSDEHGGVRPQHRVRTRHLLTHVHQDASNPCFAHPLFGRSARPETH